MINNSKIDSVFVEYSYGDKKMVTLIPNEVQRDKLIDIILEIEKELEEELK